jgi:hypothetical protein
MPARRFRRGFSDDHALGVAQVFEGDEPIHGCL